MIGRTFATIDFRVSLAMGNAGVQVLGYANCTAANACACARNELRRAVPKAEYMLLLLLLPAGLQMLAMGFDELVFHRRRGLPRWERVGHPLDTASAAACYVWLVTATPARPHSLGIYIALCAFSCLLITKDEFVHSKLCEPLENWLHALLFVAHPVVFLSFGLIWVSGSHAWLLRLELGLTVGLLFHQIIYWSPLWGRADPS